MKLIIVLATVLAAGMAMPADTYDLKFENFNIDETVENTILLESLAKCFLSEGPCTSDGNLINGLIDEALATNCAKCTPKQKSGTKKMILGFQSKVPELWEKLWNQKSPNGKYNQALEKLLASA